MRIAPALFAAAILIAGPTVPAPVASEEIDPRIAALIDHLSTGFDAEDQEAPYRIYELERAAVEALVAAQNSGQAGAFIDDARALREAYDAYRATSAYARVFPDDWASPWLEAVEAFLAAQAPVLDGAVSLSPAAPPEGTVIDIRFGDAMLSDDAHRMLDAIRNETALRRKEEARAFENDSYTPVHVEEPAWQARVFELVGDRFLFRGVVPGRLALAEGASILRVSDYAGEHSYNLAVGVTGGTVAIQAFRPHYDCLATDGSDQRLLLRMAADLTGLRFDAATQALQVPEFLWGTPACAYGLGYGSSRYVVVELTSDPDSAAIYVEGHYLADTPARLMLLVDDGSEFVLRKPGYADAAFALDADDLASDVIRISATLPEAGR